LGSETLVYETEFNRLWNETAFLVLIVNCKTEVIWVGLVYLSLAFDPYEHLYSTGLTLKHLTLSCVATRVFSVRLLRAVAFSKKLPWFEPTNVISLKTQLHAVNAR